MLHDCGHHGILLIRCPNERLGGTHFVLRPTFVYVDFINSIDLINFAPSIKVPNKNVIHGITRDVLYVLQALLSPERRLIETKAQVIVRRSVVRWSVARVPEPLAGRRQKEQLVVCCSHRKCQCRLRRARRASGRGLEDTQHLYLLLGG